ncbi:MAG: hypothetical protein C0622_02135 [Desulfuromonas sp.]|nr:MAG: hypothetical protein C0622_02135 [Desulfuromonas sp.]
MKTNDLTQQQTQTKRGGSVLCRLFLALLILVCLPLTVCAETQQTDPGAAMKERWGIEILSIRPSAANYMLDFRYRVLDADKAGPLFHRKSRPQLIEQKNGAHMSVFSSPKTGPMRTTDPPQAGKNYFILFANPGRQIQTGDLVTIVIDDFKVENLVVQ